MPDSTSPALPPVLSEAEARAITEKIRSGLETIWLLIVEAYHKRADQALGYGSWDAYVLAEFGGCALRVPREDRPEMVRSLRSQEMSTRAIATALGVSERTVRRDLDKTTAANAAVEEPIATVVGLDGRRQPASRREPFWWRPPAPPPPAAPNPITVVWDPAPPPPPRERDYTAGFVSEAGSLRRSANRAAALHKRAKQNPGRNFTDGVTALREAVEILQAVLADDCDGRVRTSTV